MFSCLRSFSCDSHFPKASLEEVEQTLTGDAARRCEGELQLVLLGLESNGDLAHVGALQIAQRGLEVELHTLDAALDAAQSLQVGALFAGGLLDASLHPL